MGIGGYNTFFAPLRLCVGPEGTPPGVLRVQSRIDAAGSDWYSSAMTIAAGYFYEIGGRRGSMLAVDHRRVAP